MIQDNFLIHFDLEQQYGFDEAHVYFLKMKADYERYICNVANFN